MNLENGRLLLFLPFLLILLGHSLYKWFKLKFRFFTTDYYALALSLSPGLYVAFNCVNRIAPDLSAIVIPYLILFPVTGMLVIKNSFTNHESRLASFLSYFFGAALGYLLLFLCAIYAEATFVFSLK
jgi:hypothetical protein